MKRKGLLLIIAFITLLSVNAQNKNYKFRKYGHVKNLYQRIADPVTKLCLKHKVPPAAVLAIISLESGWGQGYVGNITGNFLSLNTRRGETQLPALYLPVYKNRILYDSVAISQKPDSLLKWQQRPASLKKDYRPKNIRGSKYQLSYFKHHPKELTKANLENVTDFVTRFISYSSSIKAYNQARKLLDDAIAQKGTDILFNHDLNIQFINTIGGKPNSFNFRETWPKKVITILNGVGAVELTKNLHYQKDFEGSW